jgi:hypothetical protein
MIGKTLPHYELLELDPTRDHSRFKAAVARLD